MSVVLQADDWNPAKDCQPISFPTDATFAADMVAKK
jgi:hypothetical protein